MPMSTITVAGINPGLNVLGATQQLNYTQPLSALQITNSFIPTIAIPSQFDQEFRNNLFSGFRWSHKTTSTDSFGSLTLQNFVNAQVSALGNDMIRFNNIGITIFVPLNLNNGIITNATWNGNTITVPYGGTGITATTPYSVICGGTTGTGALQSVANAGTIGQVLTSQGPGALPTWSSAGSGTVTSITAGTGLTGGTITASGTIAIANTAVTAGSYAYGSFTVNAQGQLTAASNGSTPLLVSNNLSDLANASTARTNLGLTNIATQTVTQFNILVGGATNSITSVGLTNGQLLIGATGANPIAAVPTNGTNITWAIGAGSLTANLSGLVSVSNGGTGVATTTPYSIICGGTTITGALQSVANAGISGQLLTSQGPGALPTWTTSIVLQAYCNLLSSSASTTTIVTANTYVKVNATTSSSLSSLFTTTSNRMTYTGPSAINIQVSLSVDYTLSGGATPISFTIFKNGVAIPTFCSPITNTSAGSSLTTALNCLVPMANTEYIEVWATCGANGRTLTITNMNFTAVQI